MARIGKADHARILHLIDVEQQKVAEVAAEYGCSPANIYALLGKLRRVAKSKNAGGGKTSARAVSAPPDSDDHAEAETAAACDSVPASDLFSAPSPAPVPDAGSLEPAAVVEKPAPSAAAEAMRAPATVTELPRKGAVSKRGGIGASLAKPGFGLTMRTEDSDETVTPFRSLEDLLSAVKPILRAAARSPDPVWFSIRQIDLSEMEWEAA
jgi:hypothetical protein